MNFRIAILLAVLSLVAVNSTLLLLGRSDVSCETDSKPWRDYCQQGSSYNCVSGGKEYIKKEEWVKWAGPATSQYLVRTSQGDPDAFLDPGSIVLSNAVCGGQYRDHYRDYFDTRTNDGFLAIQWGEAPCYDSYYCGWEEDGTISGIVWKHFPSNTPEWRGHYGSQPQRTCTVREKATTNPAQALTWNYATEYDCFGNSK